MSGLPILLDTIDVASPCTAEWDEMAGGSTVRFCGQCRKNVYNLSEMTRGDAERVVREHEGSLCVRFYRRHDGTLLTRDCPVGLRALRLRIARRLAGAAAMFGSLLFGRAGQPMTARAADPEPAPLVQPRPGVIMGDMAPPLVPRKNDPPVMGNVGVPDRPLMGGICPPANRLLPAGWENATAATVPATESWVKSPITIPDGGTLELMLDPRFKNVWSSSPTVRNVSAAGSPSIVAPEGYCLPGRADGCLVARIAEVRHFIGTGTKLTPRKGGVVYLSINDDEENNRGDGFKDNDGEMHVLIRVVEPQ